MWLTIERSLPADYQAILRKGLAALERVEDRLVRVGHHSAEQLLEPRDVRGLKGRLGEMEPDDWRLGRVLTTLSPLDVETLKGCEIAHANPPTRDAIRDLRVLLSTYLEL